MKAAVIQKFGDIPQYAEFPDPVANEGDTEVKVKAVVLENFDKATAGGTHYASSHMFPQFPAIVGHGGIGELADGTLIGFGGMKPPYGAMAEKAVVKKEYAMPIPKGIDPFIAAALPASALTSLLPLKYGVKLELGETILINGATGVSGKVAVQIAKLLGAGKIIGTGRDDAGLQQVLALGADAVIDTRKPEDEIKAAFLKEADNGYDIVLDFLWGRPTELLLETLVPKEAGFVTHVTRLVEIGQAAGPTITLPAETLRTSGVRMTGAGDIPAASISEGTKLMWEWIGQNKLTMDVEPAPLKDIAEAWGRKTEGKRLVIVP